ncbi:hypothetical protein G6F57_019050 [Rhizopus arrhizus]|nr:hypothetical protein G6F57_019050 [Rhizopus arrhizus]
MVKAQDFITANTAAGITDVIYDDYLNAFPRAAIEKTLGVYKDTVFLKDNLITEDAYNRMTAIMGDGRQFSNDEIKTVPYAKCVNMGFAYQSRQGTTHAVGEVSLTIEQGEFVSIVGPSGCGKSTLLNMIAGFLRPTTGTIRVDGQVVGGQVPPALGYIFQKDTLLPWFSVKKNVALGLKFQGVAADKIDRRVAELLELGHLGAFADAFPHP